MILLLYSFSVRRQNGWVGGWWWGAFNYHGFTMFKLLKLCSCQNDNGWLLMSQWKVFWSWQKIIIWSDLMASKSAISILVTIWTHMYLQYEPIYIYIYLQYVPIFMYNMYSYLYTIFSHIYIQYVPTYIDLQYVPISIYTSRNMYHHIKVLVLISTKYNEVEV